MKENKYNIYTSKQPTDGDPNSRSFKRRSWKNSWKDCLAKPGKMNYSREYRRMLWKTSWIKFKLGKNSQING